MLAKIVFIQILFPMIDKNMKNIINDAWEVTKDPLGGENEQRSAKRSSTRNLNSSSMFSPNSSRPVRFIYIDF